MSEVHPKQARRILLEILYDSFLSDPLKMLTPSEIFEKTQFTREALATSAHYLHERNLVELMLGYNPPLFAAIRIAPEGVDLYEDPYRLERYFANRSASSEDRTGKLIPLLHNLAIEAEALPIEGVRKEWLLEDVSQLRAELRRPEVDWDYGAITTITRWIDTALPDSQKDGLPSLESVREIFREFLD